MDTQCDKIRDIWTELGAVRREGKRVHVIIDNVSTQTFHEPGSVMVSDPAEIMPRPEVKDPIHVVVTYDYDLFDGDAEGYRMGYSVCGSNGEYIWGTCNLDRLLDVLSRNCGDNALSDWSKLQISPQISPVTEEGREQK